MVTSETGGFATYTGVPAAMLPHGATANTNGTFAGPEKISGVPEQSEDS
jgi:hypothetical protein